MQAPTRSSCTEWVDAIRTAKSEFDALGPWQTRGLAAQVTDQSVTQCTITRTRQVEASTMFDRPYTAFVVRTQHAQTMRANVWCKCM